ncbi:MAG: PilZ domain-containing protein [Candidatus Methylomirabilales bacterium]
MDDLRAMARRSLQLFEAFIAEVRSIMAEEGLSTADAKEKIKEKQRRLLQETEELLQSFRGKVIEREQEFEAMLPPGREDLIEEARRAAHDLYRVIDRFALKEKLLRRWAEQSASAMLAEYQEALRNDNLDRIEIFEAEAERYLVRKGDPEVLSKFTTLKAQALDPHLSPTQKKAKSALAELHRIKQEATVGLSFLASASQLFGDLIPPGVMWRMEERHCLDRIDRLGIVTALHQNGRPPHPVTLMDVSKTGLQVQASEEFDRGTILDLSFESAGVTEQAIIFKVEIRWCKKEPDEPEEPVRYTLGLQFVEGTEGPWLDLLPKLLDQVDEFKALFSSFPN